MALTEPQGQHGLNVVDGPIVGERNKTPSALCRLFVDAPDPKAVAGTFRESPQSAEMIRQALRRLLVKSAFMLAQATGVEHLGLGLQFSPHTIQRMVAAVVSRQMNLLGPSATDGGNCLAEVLG